MVAKMAAILIQFSNSLDYMKPELEYFIKKT